MLTLSIIRAAVVKQGQHNLAAILAAVLLPALASATTLTHLLPLWISLLVIAAAPVGVIWLYGRQDESHANQKSDAHAI